MTYMTRRPALSDTFAKDIDRFLGSFLNEGQESKSSTTFFPVDITESKDGYRIEAEIPGVDEKDIHATVDGTLLTISAESGKELSEDEKALFNERRHGSFARSFNLPKEADSEAIEAEFFNGVLTLTLPKKEKAKPRTIDIGATAKKVAGEKSKK